MSKNITNINLSKPKLLLEKQYWPRLSDNHHLLRDEAADRIQYKSEHRRQLLFL